MPPWMVTTASGVPSSAPIRSVQVVQRVAVLGEDDELAAMPVRRRTSRGCSGAACDSSSHLRSLPLCRTVQRLLLPGSSASRFRPPARRSCGRPSPGRRPVSSVSSTSASGASSRSSMSSSSSAGQAGIAVDGRPRRRACRSCFLAQPLFQPLPAAAERLVDGLGRGRQPPLQDGQGEADRALAAFVLQGFGPVELLADVVGDVLVERGLGVGERVVDGVGPALGEQRRAVELEQLLLDQAAHQVGGID